MSQPKHAYRKIRMEDYGSLSHSRWACKYQVVFIPHYRRKKLHADLRTYLGDVFKRLAEQKKCRIEEEGHFLPDLVHIPISIPLKCSVSQVRDYIKGKSAIHLAWTYGERMRNFGGRTFWARGFLA